MILVVVAHPDDEAIWCGGFVHGMTQIMKKDITIVCVSGLDAQSPRVTEFYQSISTLDGVKGIILGSKLRSANEKLPNVATVIGEGLSQLNIDIRDIKLVITHSAYGDEHKNPHHRQINSEVQKWTHKIKIPFATFTCIPVPAGNYRPLLHRFPRSEEFHVINVAKCKFNVIQKVRYFELVGRWKTPKYYLQTENTSNGKKKMLGMYKSIGSDQHRSGYAMYTTGVEGFYFYNQSGFRYIMSIINEIKSPGPSQLFGYWRIIRNFLIRNITQHANNN